MSFSAFGFVLCLFHELDSLLLLSLCSNIRWVLFNNPMGLFQVAKADSITLYKLIYILQIILDWKQEDWYLKFSKVIQGRLFEGWLDKMKFYTIEILFKKSWCLCIGYKPLGLHFLTACTQLWLNILTHELNYLWNDSKMKKKLQLSRAKLSHQLVRYVAVIKNFKKILIKL